MLDESRVHEAVEVVVVGAARDGESRTRILARDAYGDDEPEHRAVHRRLCEYAGRRSALDAAESFDLVRAERLKLYMFHGCSTLWEYMERLLGYGPHAARERMRVARALVGLPAVSMALSAGELSFSSVRELTRVATADTEEAWLAAARGKTAHQLERLVAGRAAGDLPDDPAESDLRSRVVRIELPTEVLALLREARVVIASEQGSEVSDATLIEALCRQVLDPSNGRAGPAHQIAYRKCQECKRATQQGAGRELDVRADVIARAACDARVLGDLDAPAPARATSTVTPRVREQVFARDGARCTVPGCRAARNLDIHHIIEQEHGGPNDLWNLTLLCSGHHAALHAGFLSIVGRAPYELVVAWPYGSQLPLGIDAATRSDLLAAVIATSREPPPLPDVPRGTRSSFADPVAPRPREMRVAYRRAVGPPIRHRT